MKKYSAYKPTKIDWIGEIPNTWNLTPFKRLTQIKRGASPRPIDDPKYFDKNGEFGWVRIADVTASERYLENTTQKLSELGASLSVKRYPGDLFLSIAGTVGKPIISKIKCCIHDGFVWFPNLKINPEFLYYIFSAGLAYQGLGKMGTQLNLNTDTVGYITLPFPSEKEINQIVKYLDNRTQKIDTLVSKKQKLIDLLKEERSSIINQAVTKGIDQNVEMKESGIEWIGKIPSHWKVNRLRLLCKIDTGAKNTDDKIDGGVYPFFVRSQTVERINSYSFDGEAILTAGDGVGVGKVFHYINSKFDYHQRVYKFSDFKKVLGLYLFYYIKTNFYNVALLGEAKSTVDSLRLPLIKNFEISFPPSFNEQEKIIKYIENETSKIDNTMSTILKEINLLQEYRTALISEVVTGKIDVREELN